MKHVFWLMVNMLSENSMQKMKPYFALLSEHLCLLFVLSISFTYRKTKDILSLQCGEKRY